MFVDAIYICSEMAYFTGNLLFAVIHFSFLLYRSWTFTLRVFSSQPVQIKFPAFLFFFFSFSPLKENILSQHNCTHLIIICIYCINTHIHTHTHTQNN
ncbi:Uncharacterized protein APZ42_026071 [Daphnia magna]|uniref:Uncharacterized protein n=1 Tax=Daphnia magna TaxID=35525 RepID=A0A164SIL8_9CRUS|nr:Uncharacterized protein APZ42_026071 [Daphnia magna]